jgi:hypothetical protein
MRILAIVTALAVPVCADDKEKKDVGWTELLSAKTKNLDEHEPPPETGPSRMVLPH